MFSLWIGRQRPYRFLAQLVIGCARSGAIIASNYAMSRQLARLLRRSSGAQKVRAKELSQDQLMARGPEVYQFREQNMFIRGRQPNAFVS